MCAVGLELVRTGGELAHFTCKKGVSAESKVGGLEQGRGEGERKVGALEQGRGEGESKVGALEQGREEKH